jgi:predicted SnoaL-like aldol condensation-catalyzing enzyme
MENLYIIETNRIKIELKVTKLSNSKAIARCGENSSHSEMFLEIGIERLTRDNTTISNLKEVLIHEMGHANDKKKDKFNLETKIFNKYKDSNLLPYNLFITIKMMKIEGFAIWCDRFFRNNSESQKYDGKKGFTMWFKRFFKKSPEEIYINSFLKNKINYRAKIYSVTKSKEEYSAYNLVESLFYELGFHIYFIITLSYIKNNEILENFKLINQGNLEFNILEFFIYEKDNNIFLKGKFEENFLRQCYTKFKTFDQFDLIREYIKACGNLGLDQENRIFTKDEIKLYLKLEK